jgi:hypothetical protein
MGWISAISVALSLTLPQHASALSCDEYSINGAFWNFNKYEGTYVLAYGSFSNVVKLQGGTVVESSIWRATFQGFRASQAAFDVPMTAETTIKLIPYFESPEHALEVEQLGLTLDEWLPNERGLVFLKQTPTGYEANASGVCSPFVDTNPDSVPVALNCLNGRRCPKP